MSNYNSTNTKILAEYPQGKNTRMLLLHTMNDGRLEYVIGSYFTKEPAKICFRCGELLADEHEITEYKYACLNCDENFYEFEANDSEDVVDYSWDWGHYFNDIVSAVNYWKREVLPNYDENTCPHCGCEGELKLESTDDYDTDKSYWYRCDSCGGLSKQSFTLIENVSVEG